MNNQPNEPETTWATRPGRHIVSLSGGKDSTALAIYLHDKIPQLEYIFCDTHKELQETYAYLKRLEIYLQHPITYLNPTRGFDHWLEMYKGMLPSAQVRWCTRKLKIEPFEAYVGDDQVWLYIGIRADEDREAYISRLVKPTIQSVYPFKEAGLVRQDIERILEASGLGLPDYYEWRTRSGCFFCFFQRTGEWVGLRERYPELYEEARKYETEHGGEHYTWRQGESLAELEHPERMEQAKREHQQRLEEEARRRPGRTLIELQAAALDVEDDTVGCAICHL
jgi:hypothetical protein